MAVRFQAIVNGKVVGEGVSMDEALKVAEAAGYTREEVLFRSVREGPRV